MMWRSSYPEVPVGGTTLPAMVQATIERRSEHTALIDGASGASVSYAEFGRRVERISAWLARPGSGARAHRCHLGAEHSTVGGVRAGRHAAGRRGDRDEPELDARRPRHRSPTPAPTVIVTTPPLAEAAAAMAGDPARRDVRRRIRATALRDGAGLRRSGATGRHRSGRGGPAAVLQRNHRTAQGRSADPHQPRDDGAAGAGGGPVRRAGHGPGAGAVLPRPRRHRHPGRAAGRRRHRRHRSPLRTRVGARRHRAAPDQRDRGAAAGRRLPRSPSGRRRAGSVLAGTARRRRRPAAGRGATGRRRPAAGLRRRPGLGSDRDDRRASAFPTGSIPAHPAPWAGSCRTPS